MWKARKNIWREIQIPSLSRLMDEQASLFCPLPCSARWGPVSLEGIGRQVGAWPDRGGERFLKEGQQSQLRLLLLCPDTFSPRTGLPPLSGVDGN